MRGQRLWILVQVLLHAAVLHAAGQLRRWIEQRRWIGRSKDAAELVTEHLNCHVHAGRSAGLDAYSSYGRVPSGAA